MVASSRWEYWDASNSYMDMLNVGLGFYQCSHAAIFPSRLFRLHESEVPNPIISILTSLAFPGFVAPYIYCLKFDPT